MYNLRFYIKISFHLSCGFKLDMRLTCNAVGIGLSKIIWMMIEDWFVWSSSSRCLKERFLLSSVYGRRVITQQICHEFVYWSDFIDLILK